LVWTSSAKQPKSFSLPSDQRIRLHIHQRIAPLEHSAQGGHHPPGGIVGPSWLDLPFLEHRQLLTKEEVLGRQGTMGMNPERSESDQVDDDQRQRPEAMCKGAENRCVRHERSGLHVTEHYRSAISHRTNSLRSTAMPVKDLLVQTQIGHLVNVCDRTGICG
jgi:hypothetical protein